MSTKKIEKITEAKETILVWWSWTWKTLLFQIVIFPIFIWLVVISLEKSNPSTILALMHPLLYIALPLLYGPFQIWTLKMTLSKRYKSYREKIDYKQVFWIWFSWAWKFTIAINVIFGLAESLGYSYIHVTFTDEKFSAISPYFFTVHPFPGKSLALFANIYFFHIALKRFYHLLQ